ncbi:MAG: glutamate cyclase domain-containing protein [Gemmataceae bacterium]
MSLRARLNRIRDRVQVDVGGRGLARVPDRNLFTACPEDFADACLSLAHHDAPRLGIVTGFWIASAGRGETDGPLGAVYLARTLTQMGIEVSLFAEPFCLSALRVGLRWVGLEAKVLVQALPAEPTCFTHLLALERAGPSHTLETLLAQKETTPEVVQQFEREASPERRGRCQSMRGLDISSHMVDVSGLFTGRKAVTLGIGDGGNEIGMGKIPWSVIRDNIPLGGQIACGTPVDHLVVAGISNWGAYALAAGVALCRGFAPPDSWFDGERERRLLAEMVTRGDLVDGVSGQAVEQVDGIAFERYWEPMRAIADQMRGES